MKIKRFKLNDLSANEIRQKEMNAIIGGKDKCSCGCGFYQQGGSSMSDNMQANYNADLYSYTTCNLVVGDEYEGWQVVCRPHA